MPIDRTSITHSSQRSLSLGSNNNSVIAKTSESRSNPDIASNNNSNITKTQDVVGEKTIHIDFKSTGETKNINNPQIGHINSYPSTSSKSVDDNKHEGNVTPTSGEPSDSTTPSLKRKLVFGALVGGLMTGLYFLAATVMTPIGAAILVGVTLALAAVYISVLNRHI